MPVRWHRRECACASFSIDVERGDAVRRVRLYRVSSDARKGRQWVLSGAADGEDERTSGGSYSRLAVSREGRPRGRGPGGDVHSRQPTESEGCVRSYAGPLCQCQLVRRGDLSRCVNTVCKTTTVRTTANKHTYTTRNWRETRDAWSIKYIYVYSVDEYRRERGRRPEESSSTAGVTRSWLDFSRSYIIRKNN